MKGNVAQTCTALLVLSMVFFACTGTGCLVDNEDTSSDAKVIETPLALDLDGNGTGDFDFSKVTVGNIGVQGSGTPYIRFNPRGENALVNRGGGGNGYGPVVGLAEGVRLDSSLKDSLTWSSFGADLAEQRFGETEWEGPFVDRKKYLGLRVGKGDTAHYGWALVSIDTTRTDRLSYPFILLYDYAVSPRPGAPIETGETQ